MKSELVADLEHLVVLDPKRRPHSVILVVRVRNDGVEPVVAAAHLEDNQDPFGIIIFDPGQRIGREGQVRLAQEKRHGGADAERRGRGLQKVAPRSGIATIFVFRHQGISFFGLYQPFQLSWNSGMLMIAWISSRKLFSTSGDS